MSRIQATTRFELRIVGDASTAGATRRERGIFRSVDGVLSSRQKFPRSRGLARLC